MIEFSFKKDELKKMIDGSPADCVNVSVTVNFAPGDANKVFPATVLATPVKADGTKSATTVDSVKGCPVPPNCN